MLYHLLYGQLAHWPIPIFNVFRYITFRTAGASVTALAISLRAGADADPPAARLPDRPGDPAGRAADAPRQGRHADDGRPADPGVRDHPDAALGEPDATPTSGSPSIATTGVRRVGFADDYLKIVRRSHHGLWPRYKMGVAGRHRRRRRPGAAGADAVRSVQHAPALPVLQAADSRSRLGLRPVRGVRLRRAGPTRSTSPTASTGWRSACSASRPRRSPR